MPIPTNSPGAASEGLGSLSSNSFREGALGQRGGNIEHPEATGGGKIAVGQFDVPSLLEEAVREVDKVVLKAVHYYRLHYRGRPNEGIYATVAAILAFAVLVRLSGIRPLVFLIGIGLGAYFLRSEPEHEREAASRLTTKPTTTPKAETMKQEVTLECGMTWMNDFVATIWPQVDTWLVQLMQNSVAPSIAKAAPKSLQHSVHFTNVTLGKARPTFDKLTMTRRASGNSQIDVAFAWDSDVNITLQVGPFLIQLSHLSIKCDMSIVLVLVPSTEVPPFLKGMKIFCANQPQVAIEFGGAARFAEFPGIQRVIHDAITGAMDSMIVAPKCIGVDMNNPKDDDYVDLAHMNPVGVLRITVHSGHDLVAADGGLLSHASSDPFVQLTVGIQTYKTPTVYKRLNPVWQKDNVFDFIIYDRQQTVDIEVFDEDKFSSNDLIGYKRDLSLEELRTRNVEMVQLLAPPQDFLGQVSADEGKPQGFGSRRAGSGIVPQPGSGGHLKISAQELRMTHHGLFDATVHGTPTVSAEAAKETSIDASSSDASPMNGAKEKRPRIATTTSIANSRAASAKAAEQKKAVKAFEGRTPGPSRMFLALKIHKLSGVDPAFLLKHGFEPPFTIRCIVQRSIRQGLKMEDVSQTRSRPSVPPPPFTPPDELVTAILKLKEHNMLEKDIVDLMHGIMGGHQVADILEKDADPKGYKKRKQERDFEHSIRDAHMKEVIHILVSNLDGTVRLELLDKHDKPMGFHRVPIIDILTAPGMNLDGPFEFQALTRSFRKAPTVGVLKGSLVGHLILVAPQVEQNRPRGLNAEMLRGLKGSSLSSRFSKKGSKSEPTSPSSTKRDTGCFDCFRRPPAKKNKKRALTYAAKAQREASSAASSNALPSAAAVARQGAARG